MHPEKEQVKKGLKYIKELEEQGVKIDIVNMSLGGRLLDTDLMELIQGMAGDTIFIAAAGSNFSIFF